MTHELRRVVLSLPRQFCKVKNPAFELMCGDRRFYKTFNALYIDWDVSRAFPRISMKTALLLPLAF